MNIVDYSRQSLSKLSDCENGTAFKYGTAYYVVVEKDACGSNVMNLFDGKITDMKADARVEILGNAEFIDCGSRLKDVDTGGAFLLVEADGAKRYMIRVDEGPNKDGDIPAVNIHDGRKCYYDPATRVEKLPGLVLYPYGQF